MQWLNDISEAELLSLLRSIRCHTMHWGRDDASIMRLILDLKLEPRSMVERIKSLANLVEIQTSHGNWDHDEYHHGMANGMILALSIMTDTEPKYKDAPKKWGRE